MRTEQLQPGIAVVTVDEFQGKETPIDHTRLVNALCRFVERAGKAASG